MNDSLSTYRRRAIRCNTNTLNAYHQVSYDDSGQEEWDAHLGGDPHAVPHGLDPFSTEHPENDHEAVHEVHKVPARKFLSRKKVDVVWKKENSLRPS